MGPCVAAFENGTQVTLTASPTGQSRFDGWGGSAAQCQGNSTCVLTVTAPLIVSAQFTKIPMRTLTVAKIGDGSGTVTSTPGGITCGTFCSGMFLEGTSVKLTAALDPGNVFLGWSGNAQAEACQAQGDCTISINGDATVRARFEKMGTALWLATFGGPNLDIATAVASDSAGNVFVAGHFKSPIDFGCANCSFTPRGDSDVFVAKLSRDDGTAIWAKSFGGASTDIVSAMAVDPVTDDVAVFGTFRGTANFGGADLQGDINGTLFVARYRGTDGQHSWSRRIRGEVFENFKAAVAFDQHHDVVVTAGFGDFVDFDEPGWP
jgi:Divergent InlB B-repeat domain